MPTSPKATGQQESKTLMWFEHEIVTRTPQVGILDGVSLGVLSIAENAGRLAGEWKSHRILMHDLDTEQVTAMLGELLGAVVQMGHTVGISLESLAEYQVQRVRSAPTGAHHRKTTPAAAPAKPSTAGEEGVASTRPARSRKRIADAGPPKDVAPRRRRAASTLPGEASPATTAKPARSAAHASRTIRLASSGSAPLPTAGARTESSPKPTRRQHRATSPVTIQPTLLGAEPTAASQKKPASTSAKRTRSAAVS
jgi:hypothetical protein